ncbi:hypothetical protein LTR40_003668 [Exophiala xenobiotica]|nr:hypothetical protein LTR40_003668 [Exophiala xenobiotica]KAK5347939.1 hypothetical protein LTR61_008191 [Exophiala xenobiotica]KAK5401749.1 hypothetical protein LTR06_010856 [Exophiala xenobiotica]
MPNRFRAAKACQTCHQRRIKCDAVTAGAPCSNCRQLNLGKDCVLIKSKRGTYDRKALSQERTSATDQRVSGIGRYRPPSVPEGQVPSLVKVIPNRTASNGQVISRGQEEGDAPEAASNKIQTPQLVQTPSTTTSTCCTDVDWATLFDHFLDCGQQQHVALQKGSITYLGESFPLAIILEDLKDHGRSRLHYPTVVQTTLGSEERPSENQQQQQQHPSHMPADLLQLLESNGSFSAPKKDVSDKLVAAFFRYVYPFYPIVNRKEFMHSYELGQTPWILLQAAFFAAITFGPGSLIHAAGFSERKQARTVFYNRARWLFDFGYERNKVMVLQSVILLTLWGGDPHDFWNFYSRIGTAVTIAESLGIHRTTSGTNMPQKDKSLLRRLWWVLVFRDAFCAVLFGRPLRINMIQCDVEMPTPEDFDPLPEEDDAGKGRVQLHGLFNIELSKLAVILRNTMLSRFLPQRIRQPEEEEVAIRSLRQELREWRSSLNPLLDWHNYPPGSNMYASSLSLVYDSHLILIHLQSPPSQQLTSIPSSSYSSSLYESFSLRVSQDAAHRIASLGSVLTTKNLITIMPHDAIVAFLSAEVVFYNQMRSPEPSVAQMARIQLNMCQMIMHEIRDFWDSAPWITQLFSNLASKVHSSTTVGEGGLDVAAMAMEEVSSPNLNIAGVGLGPNGGGLSSNNNNTSTNTNGGGGGGGAFNTWPEHPVFSDFLPNDPGALGDLTDFSLFTSNATQLGDLIPPPERYPFVMPPHSYMG